MIWPFLAGAAAGCSLTLLTVFRGFVVQDADSWEESEQELTAARSCVEKAVADNALLRAALASEMTPTAKKVAAMALAALGADIATVSEAAERGG